ncbi:MAG: DNA alkylation repair protein [Cyanobacteria bacterium SIG28]|nr:DNA alkylation repair protein [Cyanobacteria bacterium SIG28]
MYQEIIENLKALSESKFAGWLAPFLSINENSEEKILGIRVPILRKMAKNFCDIDTETLEKLLSSNYHEAKSLAIFIMLLKSKKEPNLICELYLKNLEYINNWDLVDYSAPHIVAPNVDKEVLKTLAESDYLWANRVAMVSTIYYIKQKDYALTLEFAKKFITHPHHLMHKASGWMLREVGKQDEKVLIEFLNKYSSKMPSVMRSYAKERLK